MELGEEDFYVQQGRCLSCGVPQAVAPTLVGWRDTQNSTDCYWIRQPQTPDELEQAIKVIHEQEVDCHRYAGTDPSVIRRLPAAQCDFGSIGLSDSIWRRLHGWYQLSGNRVNRPVVILRAFPFQELSLFGNLITRQRQRPIVETIGMQDAV
jgi:hypothetical protein